MMDQEGATLKKLRLSEGFESLTRTEPTLEGAHCPVGKITPKGAHR